MAGSRVYPAADATEPLRRGVSATAGIKDDTRLLQVSAPVRPGNSGGSLLDDRGRVLGVVVSKLDAVKVAQSTGENVNFAIKADVVKIFLRANGVAFNEDDTRRGIVDAREVHAQARHAIVFVTCE